MKFKKLEVSGFKSFADKLDVKFGAGITAIVGPNGCGKSNVADSIRWVLGEQSAKLLRGSSMQDVIFNGTENRKSLSFCEVSLYFDNTEKLFPTLDYNEVVITRKLYRDGESEYLLNKTNCRLKDITSLLRDAGMGREGYSIIGQGRIDELLSAKPEDRREIFEEAAGISKFKAKKKEAERKLVRTTENLTRVIDILDEKAKMLEPLSRQSENARKWLDLRDKLKTAEINTYIYQYDTASEAKAVINTRLNGILEELEIRQKESESTLKDYNDAMVASNDADKSIELLREELLTLTVGMEKQAGEVKLLNERMGNLSSQNIKLREDNQKLDNEYNDTLKFIEQGKALLDVKKEELERQKAEAEKLAQEYFTVVETLTKGEDEVESQHKALVAAMDKLSDIKSNMSRLLAEKEGLEVKSVDLKNRIKFNSDKLNVDSEEEKYLKSEIEKLGTQKADYEKQRDEAFTLNNEALYLAADADRKLSSFNEKFYTLSTRHKMLTEIHEAREGFNYSVKKLLSDAKENKQIAAKMEGVFAELITVNEGYETAIETALGNAVQNIVTKNEEDAKYLIAYLKEKRYGRATFLPMSSFKPRVFEDQFRPLLKTNGCRGIASTLISFDEKYGTIVEGLLGNTVIVDNIDTAVDMAKSSRYSFRIVTLDGDIINTQGSISGGSKKSELTNLFTYDREIKELKPKLDALASEIKETENIKAAQTEKSQTASKTAKDLADKVHELEVNLATKNESYSKICGENENLTKVIGNLEFELLEGTERIAAIEKDINSVSTLENLITTEKENASAGGQERQQQFESLRAERDKLHNLMTNARVSVSTTENVIENTETEVKRLQENTHAVVSKIEYNNLQLEENNEVIERIDADLKTFTTTASAGDGQRQTEIRQTLANLDEFKQSSQKKVSELDEKRMQLIQNIQELHDKRNKEEMQLMKVDTDIEVMEQRILEEYELDYQECLKFKEDDFNINQGVQDVNRLKRQMNALGNINLNAIDQCKEMYESYNELNLQKDDLVKAQADLNKIIADLSGEMLGRFTEKFEKIRTNFQGIFKELFNGGNADLILLESENPLEAGIEIVAQPPEKKLQSISLLSGGERALTAIAILFAILRLKPMPFCVLDEIEAALDDANAGRFAKYLRRFSEETQFIVITHRKPTMELADSLYGVTMEEKGVSKVISVKLADAVAAVEKNGGMIA